MMMSHCVFSHDSYYDPDDEDSDFWDDSDSEEMQIYRDPRNPKHYDVDLFFGGVVSPNSSAACGWEINCDGQFWAHGSKYLGNDISSNDEAAYHGLIQVLRYIFKINMRCCDLRIHGESKVVIDHQIQAELTASREDQCWGWGWDSLKDPIQEDDDSNIVACYKEVQRLLRLYRRQNDVNAKNFYGMKLHLISSEDSSEFLKCLAERAIEEYSKTGGKCQEYIKINEWFFNYPAKLYIHKGDEDQEDWN